MPLLDGFPARLYQMFWYLKVDGRFALALKDEKFNVLFEITDFFPAALMRVEKGDFLAHDPYIQ